MSDVPPPQLGDRANDAERPQDPLADGVLAVFVPGRHRAGGLGEALRKHDVQFLESWPSTTLRDRYAGREGFCLTLAGFELRAAPSPPKGRLHLPESVAAGLYEILSAVGEPIEMALLVSTDDAPRTGKLAADALGGPLQAGCRYVVSPPPFVSRPVPGRPEVEGWTRRVR